jgi:hypothetical protein
VAASDGAAEKPTRSRRRRTRAGRELGADGAAEVGQRKAS